MDIQLRIDKDIKEAMLAREKDVLNTLRAIKSAITLELTQEGKGKVLEEADGIRILKKLHKQRIESASIYREGARIDLAEEEERQARVIEGYLPKQLDEAAVLAVVDEVMASVQAKGMGDMGKVMTELGRRLAGKADGSIIARLVKERLTRA